eukprot:GFYU01005813.1.p1 GENE.GFYU01005813.1~~GFYU01005813.1.p1  ORF type:complete len:433 (+),score=63.19 GFYU01005813.1:177-1301(+)
MGRARKAANYCVDDSTDDDGASLTASDGEDDFKLEDVQPSKKKSPPTKRKRQDESEDDEFEAAFDDNDSDNDDDDDDDDEFVEDTGKKAKSTPKTKSKKEPTAKAKPKAKATKPKAATKKAAPKSKGKGAKDAPAGPGGSGTAMERIFSMLKEQNRPYSLAQLLSIFGKSFKKKEIQEALDNLVEEKKLSDKDFNKTKIYIVNQDLFPEVNLEELAAMDAQIVELTEEQKEIANEVRVLSAEYANLSNQLTLEEMNAKIIKLTGENGEMEAKLEKLADTSTIVSKADRDHLHKKYQSARQIWRARKRLCREAVDMICEASGKKPNDFMEEVGVERDEDVSVEFGEDKLAKKTAPSFPSRAKSRATTIGRAPTVA